MVRSILALISLLVATAQPAAQLGPIDQWQSTHYRDHKLVGILYLPALKRPADYSAKGQSFIRQFLLSYIASTRFVLMGEQHDNPDHHRIQAWLIDEMAKRGRRPSVVMEMIPNSYETKALRYDLNSDPKLDAFAKRLDWEKRGWYSWDIYRPIGLSGAKHGLEFVAGNLDRTQTRALSKTGLAALSKEDKERYLAEKQLPEHLKSDLRADLKNSHCGMMPDTALPAMEIVQRVRDGVMAEALVRTGRRSGGVLIAGNGHVRKDRGVPRLLKVMAPGFSEVKIQQDGETRIVRTPKSANLSIGLIEVQPGFEDPQKYGLTNGKGEALYDVVIFTPKFDITDQCAALREHFKKSKEKQP